MSKEVIVTFALLPIAGATLIVGFALGLLAELASRLRFQREVI